MGHLICMAMACQDAINKAQWVPLCIIYGQFALFMDPTHTLNFQTPAFQFNYPTYFIALHLFLFLLYFFSYLKKKLIFNLYRYQKFKTFADFILPKKIAEHIGLISQRSQVEPSRGRSGVLEKKILANQNQTTKNTKLTYDM